MSLRNSFIPMVPNGPPPPHHRVQVNVIQQQGQQGSTNSNQNGSAPPSHEYHFMPCIPYQTQPGAAPAPNLIRHIQNGSYAHPPNQQIYQTQGGQVVTNQQPQSNPSQPLSGSVQQNTARLTPMSQPTAPPTPPQQQQTGPPQTATQYVQITQQGMAAPPSAGVPTGNPRAQYRPQGQGQRRQVMGNQWIQGMPVQMGHPQMAYVINSRPPYGYAVSASPYNFNPQYHHPSTTYGQIPPNSQQRQAPQSVAPAPMPQPASTGEYQYAPLEMYSQVMPPPVSSAPQAAPTHPKTAPPAKKKGSSAILIINPNTGKSIFEDDATSTSSSTATSTAAQIASSEKTVSTSSVSDGGKTEAVEDKTSVTNLEPSTPVVSAMTDGPSVDITPKHQVHKTKKVKPPEPAPAPAPVVSQPVPVQVQQPAQQPPQQISHPQELQKSQQTVTITQPPAPESKSLPIATPEEPSEPSPAIQSQDNENNNVTPVAPVSTVTVKEVKEEEKKVEEIVVAPAPEAPIPVVEVDSNDTNNNNYQNPSPVEEEKVVKETSVKEKVPQDSNNNSTNEKPAPGVPSVRSSSVEPKTDNAPVAAAIPPARKISIIEYGRNQWSPDNLEGEKKWSREQLLQLRENISTPILGMIPSVIRKEAGAKNDSSAMSNINIQSSMYRMPAMNSIEPKFLAGMQNNRNNAYQKRPSQTGGNAKQAMQGGRGSCGPVIKVQLGVHEDVKLNIAENAWKPSHLASRRPAADKPDEDNETTDLCNRFRSMLNKLTAENFGVLVNEVKTFKIDTDRKLDGVIDLLFEKAISEPKFAPTYALLCQEVGYIFIIHDKNQPQQGQNTSQKSKSAFKVKLITQCQKEFERHKEESKVFNEIEEEISKIGDGIKDAEKEERKANLEEKHFRIRQRANGTVRFIGELYKIDMLTVKIMRQCVLNLLESPTEEKIERLCKLLTTIGAKMESEAGPEGLNQYFQTLTDLLHARKEIKSSRIRFEIQNLQDLRHNKWRPRRADLIPKTMDELQNDMEREQNQKERERFSTRQDDRNNRNNNYNNRGGRQQDNDGWNNVGSNNKQRAPAALPLNKLPTIATINSEGPPKMGMPTNFQNFNKFSALQADAEDGPPSHASYIGGSKNSSMERTSSQNRGGFYGNNGNAPYSGRSSGSNQGSRNSSQNRSRDNSNDIRGGASSRSLQGPRGPASQSTAVKQPQKSASVIVPRVNLAEMSHDEVDKNANDFSSNFKKFKDESSSLTFEDILSKMEKLRYNKDVVMKIYEIYYDQKSKDRPYLILMVCKLIERKCISEEDNRAALKEAMELAPDMMCDVPRVYEYLAEIMAELLVASAITFKDVFAFSQENRETMLKHIVGALKVNQKDDIARKVLDETNISLEKFLNDGNLERFSKEIGYNLGKQNKEDPMVTLKKMLEGKAPLEDIHACIASLGPKENLVSDLTNVLIASCYENQSSSFKLQEAQLVNYSPLIIKVIDSDIGKQLECIEGLYQFANKREFPQGLLNKLFQVFYENDVLSASAFSSWKKANSEKAGYGVVMKSTNQFFTNMAEEDDDDDYDEDDDVES